jgi:hypothetical protein
MRPIIVSVGPLAAASANNIATSQTPAGTTGSAAATFTNGSASIAATNSFVAGEQVSFLAPGGVLPAGITNGSQYFVSATGLSGSAFQVAPTFGGTPIVMQSAGTGSPVVVYGPNVALNGTLVNTSGVAVLDNPRRVLITTADTTHTFTITGTGAGGSIISESFKIVAGTSYSALDYATVTSITVSGAPTAAVTVGTNGIASTPWVRLDEWAPGNVGIQCDVVTTVNYTVQSTYDDPNDPSSPVTPSAVAWVNTSDTSAVGATAQLQTNYIYAPRYVRVLLNSSNTTGTVTATVIQYDVVSR